MWNAEILIEARRDLPTDLSKELAARISANTNHADVLKDTIHKDSNFLVQDMVCSFRDQHVVFFITKSDAKTLNIHIERLNKKASIRELKASVIEVIHRVEAFLKYCKNAIKRVDGEIFVFFEKEFTCVRKTFWARFKHSLKSNFLSKIYVPVATVFASLILDTKLEQALLNAVTAVIALFIWVLIEAAFSEKYSFCEVSS